MAMCAYRILGTVFLTGCATNGGEKERRQRETRQLIPASLLYPGEAPAAKPSPAQGGTGVLGPYAHKEGQVVGG